MTKPAKPYYANPGPAQRARDKFAVVALAVAIVIVILALNVIALTFFRSP